jgi:hypothetical protein
MSKSLRIESASLPQQQSSSNPAFDELLERIKQRAFELYEAPGCVDGNSAAWQTIRSSTKLAKG